MKIENYETFKAGISADTFTFPYNPQRHTRELTKFLDERDYAYAFTHYGMTSPIKSRVGHVLSGHFSGSTKNADFKKLKKNVNDNKIKKLYFSDDQFAIVFGRTCNEVNAGGRTNMIDYVAGFVSPFGLLFGDTEKSGGSSDTSNTNEGDVATPIEKITGSVTSGQTVVIEDADGNGITFTAVDTGTFTLRLIYLEELGGGDVFTEYYYADVDGAAQKIQRSNNDKTQILTIEPGDDLSTTFSGATITNITPTFYYRDGHSAD